MSDSASIPNLRPTAVMKLDDPRSQRERMLAGELYLADDAELVDEPEERRSIFRELVGFVGDGVEIRPPFGARTFVNFGLVALDVAKITIGDDVWLGGGVTVRPGVTIGDDSVVGAGAVVVRDPPANVVAVGNPARVIRR